MAGYNSKNLKPSNEMNKEARKEKLTRMTSYPKPSGDDVRPLPIAPLPGCIFTDAEKKYLSNEWKKQYPSDNKK